MRSLFVFILLFGCAHRPARENTVTDSSVDPNWLYSPYQSCVEEAELCATGEGKNYQESDVLAKTNLASIFEVKIKSEMNVLSSSSSMGQLNSALIREDVLKTVQESVEQILENVQIKYHFRKDGISHSLASLNKASAAELLGHRLSKIDQELTTLWNKKTRTLIRRITKLFIEREKINERYSILASSRPAPVSWEEIIKWRESKSVSVPVIFKIGQSPDWLKEKLEELLTESGFKIVKGGTDKVLSLQVDSIKEFLNIQGFEKYTFTFSLSHFESGDIRKTISTSETVTGRSQSDALLKVKNFFTDYLEEHLSDLRLD